jgi:hypothetical protein
MPSYVQHAIRRGNEGAINWGGVSGVEGEGFEAVTAESVNFWVGLNCLTLTLYLNKSAKNLAEPLC